MSPMRTTDYNVNVFQTEWINYCSFEILFLKIGLLF
jgi:hypothetical protein